MHQPIPIPAPPDGERLARVEERLDAVDKRTERMEAKLDDAIACKADKSDVDDMSKTLSDHSKTLNRIVGALVLIAAGVPFAIWLLDRLFGN